MKYKNGRAATIGDRVVGIAGGHPVCGLLVGPAEHDEHLACVAHVVKEADGKVLHLKTVLVWQAGTVVAFGRRDGSAEVKVETIILTSLIIAVPAAAQAVHIIHNKSAPALLKQPEAWSTLRRKGSTMEIVAEVWRQVVGHQFYEVSDLGRVRSLDRDIESLWHGQPYTRPMPGRVLKLKTDKNGYAYVIISPNHTTRKVHHLVAEAFIGPRPSGHEINHKDGNKANNLPSNLEWVTGKINIRHAFDTGLNHSGEDHYNTKLSNADVVEIRRQCDLGIRQAVIANQFGISRIYVAELRAKSKRPRA